MAYLFAGFPLQSPERAPNWTLEKTHRIRRHSFKTHRGPIAEGRYVTEELGPRNHFWKHCRSPYEALPTRIKRAPKSLACVCGKNDTPDGQACVTAPASGERWRRALPSPRLTRLTRRNEPFFSPGFASFLVVFFSTDFAAQQTSEKRSPASGSSQFFLAAQSGRTACFDACVP